MNPRSIPYYPPRTFWVAMAALECWPQHCHGGGSEWPSDPPRPLPVRDRKIGMYLYESCLRVVFRAIRQDGSVPCLMEHEMTGGEINHNKLKSTNLQRGASQNNLKPEGETDIKQGKLAKQSMTKCNPRGTDACQPRISKRAVAGGGRTPLLRERYGGVSTRPSPTNHPLWRMNSRDCTCSGLVLAQLLRRSR